MAQFIKTLDDTIDGLVQGELIVIGTIFTIGVGLSVLGLTLNESWLIKAPLIVGGFGAMLIGFRMFYAHKMGF